LQAPQDRARVTSLREGVGRGSRARDGGGWGRCFSSQQVALQSSIPSCVSCFRTTPPPTRLAAGEAPAEGFLKQAPAKVPANTRSPLAHLSGLFHLPSLTYCIRAVPDDSRRLSSEISKCACACGGGGEVGGKEFYYRIYALHTELCFRAKRITFLVVTGQTDI
jgi:hypothetical protein